MLSYIHVHRPSPLTATTDRVFLSMDGLPMTRKPLAGIVGRLKKASGVNRLHAHLFRHTFAVKYLASFPLRSLSCLFSRRPSYGARGGRRASQARDPIHSSGP